MSTGEPELDAPPPEKRRSWIAVVRIVVSVGLLAILVSRLPDFDGVIPASDHRRTFSLLVAAGLVTLAGVVLSAWRWQRVLIAYDVHVPLTVLTTHYTAGLFVGNVLPSTIGGDVLRVTRSSQSTGSSEIAFGSVVIERLTGFFALPFLVLLSFVLDPALIDHDRAWLALLIAGITLGALGVILALAAHPQFAGRFREHENWMRFIGTVHVGVDRVRRAPHHLFAILGTALLYQVSVVISVLLIGEALQIDIPWQAWLMVVPAVAMVQVVPISISGLGVREGMLVLFLVPLGVSRAEAIAVGLLWFAAMLAVSMTGAPAFAVGSRQRHRDHTRDRSRIPDE